MLALAKARENFAESDAADVRPTSENNSTVAVASGPDKPAFVESSEREQDRRYHPEADQHLWAPSLVNHLPNELLRHIFLETGNFVAVDQGDVFNIMAVCRRWQSVARSVLSLLPSPIYRLPNKLLIRIFLFSLADLDSAYVFDQPGGSYSMPPVFERDTIFALTMVCHRWRSVVLSTSELWATLSVDLVDEDDFMKERNSVLEKIIDLHLERSGQQLLSLTITADWWSKCDSTAEHPLWPKLVASSSRWKNCELCLDGDPDVMTPSLVGIQLPNLERLQILFGMSDPVDLGFIDSAPKLRSLHGGPFLLSSSTVTLLRQVTVLATDSGLCALASKVQKSFIRMLENCPNLQSLAFEQCYDANPPSCYQLSPLYVPITHMEIMIEHSPVPSTILSLSIALITASKLTELIIKRDEILEEDERPVSVISLGPEQVQSAFSVLHDFLVRSNCALTVLVLRGVLLSDRQAVQLLRLTPTLVELTICDASSLYSDLNHCPVSKYFIRSLHSYNSSPLHPSAVLGPLVPRLRLLHLLVRSTPFDYDTVSGTVSSRWFSDTPTSVQIGVECLRSVVLELSEKVDDEKAEPLVKLDREGLRVVIKRMGA